MTEKKDVVVAETADGSPSDSVDGEAPPIGSADVGIDLGKLLGEAERYERQAQAALRASQTYPRNTRLLWVAHEQYGEAVQRYAAVLGAIGSHPTRTMLALHALQVEVEHQHTAADHYYYVGDMPNNIVFHERAATAMEACLAFALEQRVFDIGDRQAFFFRGRAQGLWADAMEGRAIVAERMQDWASAAELHAKEKDHKRQEVEEYSVIVSDQKNLAGSRARWLSAEQSELFCRARLASSAGNLPETLAHMKRAAEKADEAYRTSPDWMPYREIAEQARRELRRLLAVTTKRRIDLQYRELEISFTSGGSNSACVRIEVRSTDSGEATGEFHVPFSQLELGGILGRIAGTIGRRHGVLRSGSQDHNRLVKVGRRLHAALWANAAVRGVYESASALALSKDDGGLRLRLVLDSPVLHAIPWEFLHDGEQFMVVSQRTPLVRHVRVSRAQKPLQVAPPLRMLVAVSAPANEPKLDVEREWSMINGALEGSALLVKVELMENTSYKALTQRLNAARIRGEGYHIIHYIGHGDFDDDSGTGFLLLKAALSDDSERCSGELLANLLRDHPTVRLVVLNSCLSARGDRSQSFASVAEKLVRLGIPAVVAMQFPITDEAAIVFSEYFYSTLAFGYPVDAAIAEARKAIYATQDTVEFGTPVLYMRSKESVLFDMSEWLNET